MAKIAKLKYAEQIAYLRENHDFSQAHANALVMYSKGSVSTRRFQTPSDYYASLSPEVANTVRAVVASVCKQFPKLELVIAWNQPMFKQGTRYVFGVMGGKNHVLIAPFDPLVLQSLGARLGGYEVNKKTVRVPVGWKVDAKLLRDMIAPQLTARN